MRRNIDVLLAILRGHLDTHSFDEAAFEQLVELAEHEHVLPSVVQRCLAQPAIPSTIRHKLKAAEREASIAAFYWTSELTRVLQGFAHSQLKVVLLKGPFLAHRLYGGAALRSSYDLDLLVAKDQLGEAEDALLRLGFKPGTPDDYHRQWFRGPTTVELHHDVENPLAFDFDTSSAIARSQPAVYEGQPCWHLAPGDELVFLCLHGVRHRFERLSLVLDLCHAFRTLQPPALESHSSGHEQRTSLLTLGLAMAKHLDPTIEPLLPLQATAAQKRHLERVAARLWHRLLNEESEVLDWQALHAFYVEMELPRNRLRRQISHLRILLQRVIAADYEFAARLGFHQTWQVRLLRPLRLAFDVPRRYMFRAIAEG